MTFQTVEQMQERISELEGALCALEDAISAQAMSIKMLEVGAVQEERAKIVDHIRKVADRVENDPNGIVWGHLLATAIVIEAGEHLK